MATLKLKQRLPQRFALTGLRKRTGLEKSYTEGVRSVPTLSGSQQMKGLTGTDFTPNYGPGGGEVGESAGISTPSTAEDFIGQMIGDEMAAAMIGKGVKGGALASIHGFLNQAPIDAYPTGVIGAIARGAFLPASIAKAGNVAAGGMMATGPAAEKGVTMTGLTNDPVIGGLAEINAFQSDPHHASALSRGWDVVSDAAFGEDPGYSEDPGFQVSLGKGRTGPQGQLDPTQMNPAITNALEQSIQRGGKYSKGLNINASSLHGEIDLGATGERGGVSVASPAQTFGMSAEERGLGVEAGQGGNVGLGMGPGDAPSPGHGDIGADGEGTVLCSVLYLKGIMPKGIYEADAEYGKSLPQDVIDGYHLWAIPVAGWMTRSELFTKVMTKPIMSWAKHMSGERTKFGTLCEKIGVPVCRLIGRLKRLSTTRYPKRSHRGLA